MARKYFIAYHSYLKAVETLTEAEIGRLFVACLNYSMSGAEQELRGNERHVYPLIRSQIDRDAENYSQKCQKNRENIIRRYTNVNERIRTSTKSTKEKEKDKEKEKEKEKENNSFDAFWAVYPKKVGKQAAKKAFEKVNADIGVLIDSVERQKTSSQWKKDGGQYIPNPTTWLNQGRWEDELPETEPQSDNVFFEMLRGAENDEE